MKATTLQVNRFTRERITDLLLRNPANAACIAECRAAAERSGPVIILGLRTENRTLTDLLGFCERLVTFLAHRVGQATLVIDGHNSHSGIPGQLIRSHGENQKSRSPIVVELEILLSIQQRAAGTNISIVSTIGMPLETSLIWGCCSTFFITMWGAGLAKYRWVCNKPGLVITSHWNLSNRGDLRIYDSPLYQEDPAPMEFIDATAVHDRPDAPLLLQPGEGYDPWVMNFDLDEQAAFSSIGELLNRYVGKRDRISRCVE